MVQAAGGFLYKENRKMKQLYVDDELHDAIKTIADDRGMKLQALVNQIITSFLEKHHEDQQGKEKEN